MEINTSIYGTPESWVSFSTATDKADLKIPVWGNGTYKNQWYGGFETGVFTLNEDTIDKSIAPWGINANAAINNKKYLYVTMKTSGGSFVDNPEPQTRDVYNDNNKPLPAIFAITDPLSYGINQYDQYAYNADQLRTNGKTSRPITNFTYNNIVICPQIVCGKVNAAQNAGYDVFTCTIRDYFDTYINTYPVIIRIYVDGDSIYYGQPSVNVVLRTLESSSIGHVDTRTTAVYPVEYDGNISPLRQAMKAVTNNRITIVGMDNNTTPPTIQCPNYGELDLSDDDTAFAYVTIYNSNAFYFADNGKIEPKSHVTTSTNNYLTTVWETPTEEEVLKECAYLGFWFATSTTTALNSAGGTLCTDDNLYLPKFDDAGITTGEYYHGIEAGENAPADDVSIRDLQPDYDPNAGGDIPDEDSGDLSNAGNYLHKFGAEGLTIWAFYRTSLGGNGLDAAINAITDLYLTDPDGNEKWQLDFKGSNPDDYIVSLMAFPLRFTLSESTYTFKLGPVDFEGVDVKKYADTGFFTFGSVTVPAYGDFRDYAPYTTAELYIPFCGTCDIDMAFFAGRDLIVDMYYDIYTGSCAAAIYRYTSLGKTLYKTINGQIGVEIPLSAARMGDYQSTLHALETAQKQNDIRIATSVLGMGITAGATIATGGATLPLLAAGVASSMGVVSSVQKSDELNYQIEHTQPKPTQTTAASTQNNYCVGGTRCMLFIKRAHMDSGYNADVYGKTKGFACLLNNTVNDNSGLTVCSNIDTSDIPATADEINAIKQAFASGVII